MPSSIELLDILLSQIPDATGALPSIVLGVESGQLKRFPVRPDGEVLITFINAPGRDLTFADRNGGYLRADDPGQCAMVLPTDATLGIVAADHLHSAPRFRFLKTGLGELLISPVDGTVTIDNPNGLAPIDLPRGSPSQLLWLSANHWVWT